MNLNEFEDAKIIIEQINETTKTLKLINGGSFDFTIGCHYQKTFTPGLYEELKSIVSGYYESMLSDLENKLKEI